MWGVIPEKLYLYVTANGFEDSAPEIASYFSDLSADTWSCC